MSATSLGILVLTGGSVAALIALLGQCRKPTGWIGRAVAARMNASHRELTAWGLDNVHFGPGSQILDVGCGGGRTLRELADLAVAGRILGIDYSTTCTTMASRTNAGLISSGRVAIAQANVMKLPLADRSFDAATAIETHYYWPNLVEALRQIRRVLRPGGFLVVVAECYLTGRLAGPTGLVMRLLGGRALSPAEHSEAMLKAGFEKISIMEDPAKGWICVVATRCS